MGLPQLLETLPPLLKLRLPLVWVERLLKKVLLLLAAWPL
jgi:hypothetical protein